MKKKNNNKRRKPGRKPKRRNAKKRSHLARKPTPSTPPTHTQGPTTIESLSSYFDAIELLTSTAEAESSPAVVQDVARHDFTIAIGTHLNGSASVASELALVKSAILYAGHIRLYSPTCALLRHLSGLRSSASEDIMDMAAEFGRATGAITEEDYRNIRLLRMFSSGKIAEVVDKIGDAATKLAELTGRPVSQSQRESMKESASRFEDVQSDFQKISRSFESVATPSRDRFFQAFQPFIGSPDFVEILEAEREGLLTFSEPPIDLKPTELAVDFAIAASGRQSREGADRRSKKMLEWCAATMSQSVSAAGCYPLLDNDARQFIASQNSGRPKNSVRKAAALGENLFGRLPVASMPMGELIQLRYELDRSVTRFRRALVTTSEDIKSLPWDSDFPREVQFIYERNIAPKLEEIEDLIESTPALRGAFASALPAATALVAALPLYLSLDKVSAISSGVLATVAGSYSVAKTWLDSMRSRDEKQKKARSHDWYLYYEARRNVERG